MTSCVPSGAAQSSRMKAIKIKYMHCWCPARLKAKRDTGVLSSCLLPHKLCALCRPGGRCAAAGWLPMVMLSDFGVPMVILSGLGQRFSSSDPGFEFTPETTLHTVPCLPFC